MIKKTYLFAFIILTVICLPSCDNNEADLKITEAAGLAEYRIKNQSSKTLTFKSNPEIIIQPNETKKIGEDGGIGIVAPLPSEGLGGLKLYRLENGIEILAIEREPIDNGEWMEEKQDDQEYGLVYYTMTIDDEIIN